MSDTNDDIKIRRKGCKAFYKSYGGEKVKYPCYIARIGKKMMSKEEAIKPRFSVRREMNTHNTHASVNYAIVHARITRGRDYKVACETPRSKPVTVRH